MIQKEVNEIRRHLTPDRNCIGKIYGCYVNVAKEIIATSEQSVALMPEDELERFLSLFKKTLSGGVGKSMVDLDFSTAQVESGEEHALLTKLRATLCADADARNQLYRRIIDTLELKDTNYLILLCADSYDVPWRSKDGEESERVSDTMFTYLLCTICPVASGKTALGYDTDEKGFHNCTSAQTVSPPELGFMFPAFDGRRANIYGTLYYSRNSADMHSAFVENFFHTDAPMAPDSQRETFEDILSETLQDQCSFDVIQNVHEQIRTRIEEHKESKDPDPLDLSARDVGGMLRANEIPEEKIEAFQQKCIESFGPGASLNPLNIVDTKKFQLTMPQIKISVVPESSYLIETKVINGRKYLLIPADEGVEVNGVAVRITPEKE